MVNQKHMVRLRQGVQRWNTWRQKRQAIEPDLIGAQLRQSNLSGAHLHDAQLMLADLSFANLAAANLTDADLSRALTRSWRYCSSLSWAASASAKTCCH
jgi:uncharacterized protein YjbI with pentapeptide repeats